MSNTNTVNLPHEQLAAAIEEARGQAGDLTDQLIAAGCLRAGVVGESVVEEFCREIDRQPIAARAGVEVVPMTWGDLQPMIRDFWAQAEAQLTPRSAPGRLKQWLAMLTRNYPEAVVLFNAMRRETDCEKVRHLVNNPPADAA